MIWNVQSFLGKISLKFFPNTGYSLDYSGFQYNDAGLMEKLITLFVLISALCDYRIL